MERGDRVEVKVGEHTHSAVALDISTSGMRLEISGAMLGPGDRVMLVFSLPELDEKVEAQASVCWVDRVRGEICGVQFSPGLRAREVWAINRLKREST